jgi:hypothetical protein
MIGVFYLNVALLQFMTPSGNSSYLYQLIIFNVSWDLMTFVNLFWIASTISWYSSRFFAEMEVKKFHL